MSSNCRSFTYLSCLFVLTKVLLLLPPYHQQIHFFSQKSLFLLMPTHHSRRRRTREEASSSFDNPLLNVTFAHRIILFAGQYNTITTPIHLSHINKAFREAAVVFRAAGQAWKQNVQTLKQNVEHAEEAEKLLTLLEQDQNTAVSTPKPDKKERKRRRRRRRRGTTTGNPVRVLNGDRFNNLPIYSDAKFDLDNARLQLRLLCCQISEIPNDGGYWVCLQLAEEFFPDGEIAFFGELHLQSSDEHSYDKTTTASARKHESCLTLLPESNSLQTFEIALKFLDRVFETNIVNERLRQNYHSSAMIGLARTIIENKESTLKLYLNSSFINTHHFDVFDFSASYFIPHLAVRVVDPTKWSLTDEFSALSHFINHSQRALDKNFMEDHQQEEKRSATRKFQKFVVECIVELLKSRCFNPKMRIFTFLLSKNPDMTTLLETVLVNKHHVKQVKLFFDLAERKKQVIVFRDPIFEQTGFYNAVVENEVEVANLLIARVGFRFCVDALCHFDAGDFIQELTGDLSFFQSMIFRFETMFPGEVLAIKKNQNVDDESVEEEEEEAVDWKTFLSQCLGHLTLKWATIPMSNSTWHVYDLLIKNLRDKPYLDLTVALESVEADINSNTGCSLHYEKVVIKQQLGSDLKKLVEAARARDPSCAIPVTFSYLSRK